MALPAVGTLVLFLGSDSALAERMGAHPEGLSWVGRFVVPSAIALRTQGPRREAGEPRDRLFPPDQVMCAERVLGEAQRAQRTVRIVDVNEPGDDRELVGEFVTPSDVLPVLLRADGNRLVGVEQFTGQGVRTFVRAA